MYTYHSDIRQSISGWLSTIIRIVLAVSFHQNIKFRSKVQSINKVNWVISDFLQLIEEKNQYKNFNGELYLRIGSNHTVASSNDVGGVIKDSTTDVASYRLKGDHERPISDLSIFTSSNVPSPEGRDSYAEK